MKKLRNIVCVILMIIFLSSCNVVYGLDNYSKQFTNEKRLEAIVIQDMEKWVTDILSNQGYSGKFEYQNNR